MSTCATTNTTSTWITIAVVIGFGIWLFKSCTEQTNRRDLNMKGVGMLEARGINTSILPPDAGKDYYLMVNDDGSGQYSKEDIKFLLGSIVAYQEAFRLLRQKGLSETKVRQIPDYKMSEAMRQLDPQKAIDVLAKQYD